MLPNCHTSWRASTLLACALLLGGGWSVATAGSKADFLGELPQHCLAMLRIHRLDNMDEVIEPFSENLGLSQLSLGSMLESFDGLDLTSDAIIGVTLLENGELLPFVLLPVNDYATFVRAADGDPLLRATPITLVGEELQAARRGNWALITNPEAPLQDLGHLDKTTQERFAPLLQNEKLTALLMPAGFEQLAKRAKASTQNSSEITRLRRYRRVTTFGWKTLEYWETLVAINQPQIHRFRAECQGLLLAADAGADRSLSIRLALLPVDQGPVTQSPVTQSTESPDLSSLRAPLPPLLSGTFLTKSLPNERSMIVGSGETQGWWMRLATELYLDSIVANGNEFGIRQFDSKALATFRKESLVLQSLVSQASLLLITPADDQPVMSNGAFLLQVPNSKEFLQATDRVMKSWNQVVEKSPHTVDMIFAPTPLEVESCQGTRYSVDLPTAFRRGNSPTFRKVLAEFFGREGRMVLDVLPIDDRHLLISDLPDKLRDQLVASLASAVAGNTNELAGAEDNVPSTSRHWHIDLDPAALQDWRNRGKGMSYGRRLYQWRPTDIDSKGLLSIDLQVAPQAVTAHLEVPGDVVETMMQLLQSPH